MRAVITGGAGFLGSHLCRRLIKDGWDVVCFDNSATSSRANVAELEGSGRFQLVVQDVSTGLTVDGSVDLVLHFASPASPASPIDYLELPLETLRVGSSGTFHALELASGPGGSLRDGLDLGDVRRATGPSPAGKLTGAT